MGGGRGFSSPWKDEYHRLLGFTSTGCARGRQSPVAGTATPKSFTHCGPSSDGLSSGVIASMPSPKQFLSGVAGIYIGQVVGMAFLGSSGSGANLWPLTAVMMVPLMGVSILGGLIACVVFSRVSSARQQTGDVSDAPEERE